MHNTIDIFKGSEYYSNLLDSFTQNNIIDIKSNTLPISEAIFFHICKMKYAGWRQRINFKRSRKHSLSEFFQDIIAFYLKASLPQDYNVILEYKINKIQPDILIEKDGKFIFIIEIKTTIGWERPNYKEDEPFKIMNNRIEKLSETFDISKENIIYIFEDHGNVTKYFSNFFWNKDNNKSKGRPTEYPYSIIFPLFNSTDPYYWKHEKGFKRDSEYIELSDEQIINKSKNNIVTPFEEIIKLIEKI